MILRHITPLILTRNEEPNIARVIEALSWAERVVVVDSLSTDATTTILSKFPQVEVFQRAFDNHTNQWNFGLDQVRTPWVLTLDADYVLSEEFINELRELPPTSPLVGYFVRFRYCIDGRPLRGSLYPARLALFLREVTRYVDDGHTQLARTNGPTGELRSTIFHDDRKPLGDWLAAQDRYARLEVEKLRSRSSTDLGLADKLRRRIWIAPLVMPLYCLVWKGLWADGRLGLYYTLQRTYAELLLAIRLLESELTESLARKERNRTPAG